MMTQITFILAASTMLLPTIAQPSRVLLPSRDHPMSLVTRSLQEQQVTSDWQGSNTVESICAKYNEELAGIMTCTCARHGTRGKQVNCIFDAPQCDANQTLCYSGSVVEFLDHNNTSRAKETCSQYDTTGPASTCILVFPHVVGNYTLLERCEAKYSPTGVDALPCHSCSVCEEEEDEGDAPDSVVDGDGVAVVLSSRTMLEISLDCCNLQPDLRQTCVAINDGLALPWFDPIEEEGQCVSAAVAYDRVLLSAIVSLAVSYWMNL